MLTYGQFKMHPSVHKDGITMPDYIVEKQYIQRFPTSSTHYEPSMHAIQEIKLEDLLYLGEFYPMTWIMAMMFNDRNGGNVINYPRHY